MLPSEKTTRPSSPTSVTVIPSRTSAPEALTASWKIACRRGRVIPFIGGYLDPSRSSAGISASRLPWLSWKREALIAKP